MGWTPVTPTAGAERRIGTQASDGMLVGWVMCRSRTPFCVPGSGTDSLAWVSSPPDAPPCQHSHFLPKLSRKVSFLATKQTC